MGEGGGSEGSKGLKADATGALGGRQLDKNLAAAGVYYLTAADGAAEGRRWEFDVGRMCKKVDRVFACIGEGGARAV